MQCIHIAHVSIEGRYDNVYVHMYIERLYVKKANLFTVQLHGAPKEFLLLDFYKSYFWHGLILLL